jgi:hypothetical protein
VSFTGETVEIPVGQDGLTGTADPAGVTPSQLVVAQNVSYWSGVLRRESGAVLQTPVALGAAVVGGYNWSPTTRRTVIALADGSLRKDSGSGSFPTVLVSGLSAFDLLPFFTEGGQETGGRPPLLFCALSPNPPRYISGDGATADLFPAAGGGTGHPVEWDSVGPAAFVSHEGRMWGIGSGADPHRVWYSTTGDHLNYTSSSGGGSISVYPGEADRIVAGLSYKGLLILWKFPYGIYAVDTADPDPTLWRVTRLSAYIGTQGPGCIAPLDNDVLFMDTVGNLQLLSGITEFGKVGTRNLMESYDLAATIRERYLTERFKFTTMQYSPARREIHVTVTSRDSPTGMENHRIVADLNRPGKYRFRICNRDLCSSLWLAPDSFNVLRPVVGGADGRIWMLDQLGTSRSGSGWETDDPAPSAWSTGWMDLGFPVRRKLGKFMEVLVEVETEVTMVVEVWWDGRLYQTINLRLGRTGARFDHAHFDVDYFAAPQLISKRVRIVGSGRRLQLVGKSLTPGSDFGLARVFVQGDLSDERSVN